jgi:hypothetical protein
MKNRKHDKEDWTAEKNTEQREKAALPTIMYRGNVQHLPLLPLQVSSVSSIHIADTVADISRERRRRCFSNNVACRAPEQCLQIPHTEA